MAQKMYPAMPNSPQTSLSAAIDASATVIPVTNISALPPAPNLATIGLDELAETVLYTGISGSSLTGVTRGFEGTAKPWPSGAAIARNFTAYDHNAFKTNLEEGPAVPIPLHVGQNLITTDQASPLDYVIYGRTLVNLLGKDGGFESLTGYTITGTAELSSAQKKSGNTSLKVTGTGSQSHADKTHSFPLDQSKQYIIGVWVYVESFADGAVGIRVRDYNNTVSVYSAQADSGKVGQWQFIFTKIPTANTLGQGFRVWTGSITGGTHVAYFDDIRLYELSATDYAAIGTTITPTSSPSIDDIWPATDSVQHLVNPAFCQPGKNLLPPSPDSIHANATLTEAYHLTLNATATTQYSRFVVNVIPNTNYSLSVVHAARIRVVGVQNGENLVLSTAAQSVTFNTGANTQINIDLNNTASGAFTFSDWMLVLGGATALPASFEPRNDDYAYIPVTLASSIDGSVRDSFDSRTGQVLRRWETDVALDGTYAWGAASDFAGFKRIYCPFFDSSRTYVNGCATKHNGAPLRVTNTYYPTSADEVLLGYNNNGIYITVADADSGWGEDFTPSAAEVKAYAIGWRMNNGTFDTPYNGSGTKTWIPLDATDNSAAVTTVPTTPSSAITSGAYDYYRLSYQRATPVTETVLPEGSIGLHAGGNQPEVLAGVIVREPVTPVLSSGYYYIGRTTSPLVYRQSRFLAIFAGEGEDDTLSLWKIDSWANSNGPVSARLPEDLLDPAKQYYVTYQALDRYAMTTNPVDVTAYYRTTPGGVVASLVQGLADVETTVSVNVRAIAELYKLYAALGGS